MRGELIITSLNGREAFGRFASIHRNQNRIKTGGSQGTHHRFSITRGNVTVGNHGATRGEFQPFAFSAEPREQICADENWVTALAETDIYFPHGRRINSKLKIQSANRGV